MTNFEGLTDAQRAQVVAFMPLFRSSVINLVQACNRGALLAGVWESSVLALVEGLEAGTVIPDNTGLAGAQPLTGDQVRATMGAIAGLLSTANTPQQRAGYLAIIGPANTIG